MSVMTHCEIGRCWLFALTINELTLRGSLQIRRPMPDLQ